MEKTTLFIDTETTGLLDFRSPMRADHQPWPVQIAFIEMLGDRVMGSMNFIVRPPVAIPKKASDIHGITDEISDEYGLTIRQSAVIVRNAVRRAGIVVAHNAVFDTAILEALNLRVFKDYEPLEWPCIFCTMVESSPLLNLPPTDRMKAVGFNKPKPPKLEEAIRFFFDEDLSGAHDAMVDVMACKRVYDHLMAMDKPSHHSASASQ